MTDIPQHDLEKVAKIICKYNGDNPRVKIKVGDYAVKKEVMVWETYIDAARFAILHGCNIYNQNPYT